jgi:hypothetical protein
MSFRVEVGAFPTGIEKSQSVRGQQIIQKG